MLQLAFLIKCGPAFSGHVYSGPAISSPAFFMVLYFPAITVYVFDLSWSFIFPVLHFLATPQAADTLAPPLQ